MKFNLVFKTFFAVVTMAAFVSCDRDFNDIGSTVFDSNAHFDQLTEDGFPIQADNYATGPVQVNNLPINSFGVYNNPVFGSTKGEVTTQVLLAVANPTFFAPRNSIVVDSVYIHIPYYTKNASLDNVSGDTTFDLDSIQAPDVSSSLGKKFKLDVLESTNYLDNLDPTTSFSTSIIYYNNVTSALFPTVGTRLNNDVSNSQNDQFEFKNTQIKFFKPDNTTVRDRLAPGMFLLLDKTFFQNKLFVNPLSVSKMINNNSFKEYFRGLNFKVTSLGLNEGTLARMNFANGKITVIYKDYASADDALKAISPVSATNPLPLPIRKRKELTLNLSGNKVNFLTHVNSSTYNSARNASNPANIYLRGNEGAMSAIKIFDGKTGKITAPSTDVSLDLRRMKNENWQINDASITFKVDESVTGMTGATPNKNPRRLYLYDFDNRRPLIDYSFDTSQAADAQNNKTTYGGIYNKTDKTYKFRITNHLRNIVNLDSTNVRLGLVVTEDINVAGGYRLQNQIIAGSARRDLNTKYIPVMSIVNPYGTVLYGTSSPMITNRPKLSITYSKPK